VFRRRRFADVIKRQLDVFATDDADYLRRVREAEDAYDRADRDDSEEVYGDFIELVESGTEVLAEMRDTFAAGLDDDAAAQYADEFNRAVLHRWRHFALEIEDL
jgi:hypothetical protein